MANNYNGICVVIRNLNYPFTDVKTQIDINNCLTNKFHWLSFSQILFTYYFSYEFRQYKTTTNNEIDHNNTVQGTQSCGSKNYDAIWIECTIKLKCDFVFHAKIAERKTKHFAHTYARAFGLRAFAIQFSRHNSRSLKRFIPSSICCVGRSLEINTQTAKM